MLDDVFKYQEDSGILHKMIAFGTNLKLKTKFFEANTSLKPLVMVLSNFTLKSVVYYLTTNLLL